MPPRLIALVLLGASSLGCKLERTSAIEHPDPGRGRIALANDYTCEVAEGGAVDCWGGASWLAPDLFLDVPRVCRSAPAARRCAC